MTWLKKNRDFAVWLAGYVVLMVLSFALDWPRTFPTRYAIQRASEPATAPTWTAIGGYVEGLDSGVAMAKHVEKLSRDHVTEVARRAARQ